MPLEARFVPLVGWPLTPTPDYKRKHAPFRVGYQARLDLLQFELAKLGASDVVIQAQFEAREIRNDGWPRSSARPKGPAVIVSFKARSGPMSFPCDTFTAWEDNLYAIALSLEALRAVDRYGVTRRGEQYQGWAQLPPPQPVTGDTSHFSTPKEASAWLASVAGVVDGRPLFGHALEFAYKAAAKKLHPDAGGSTADFQRLQDAMRVLRTA